MRKRDVWVVDLLPEPLSSREDAAAALEGEIYTALEALGDAASIYDRGLGLLVNDVSEAVRGIGIYLRTGENPDVADGRASDAGFVDFSGMLSHLASRHTIDGDYQGGDGLEATFSPDTMPFLVRILADAVQAGLMEQTAEATDAR